MATIAALTEDFGGAAAGVDISTSNTIYDTITGTATENKFHGSGPVGSTQKSQRIVCGGGNSINNADITPVSAVYLSFYLYIEEASATSEAIVSWFSSATKVGDFRVLTDGTVQLRDDVNSRWISTPLATGQWHRIEIKCDPGEATGHLVNVWSGGNLNGTVTPSQTSGNQTATQAGLASGATVSQIKYGAIGNETTLVLRFARLRGDNAAFPAPIASSNAAPTANAGPDQNGVEPGSTVTLTGGGSDSDGTIASYAWEQTGGTPVSLSGSGANRTFTAPATSATLTFQLTVTDDDGATGTDTVVVNVVSSDTTIAELTEDYSGASANTAITTANTIFDNQAGSPSQNVFHGSGPTDGVAKSQRIVCGGGFSTNRADITPISALYFSFYLYIEANVEANNAILNWYSGTTKVGDLQLTPAGELRLRDYNTSRWTSTPLTTGQWHRVEVRSDPGSATGHTVRVWSGSKLNETSPATPSQTSGNQTANLAPGLSDASTIDNVRLGVLTADATAVLRFARLRGNSAAYPAPATSANVPPVANAGSDQSGVAGGATVTLNGSGSTDSDGTIVSYSWAQTGGSPTVTLSGTGASRTFVAPSLSSPATLTFTLTVVDDSGASHTDSMTVQINSSSVTANAGADQVDKVPYSTVTLTGSGTGTGLSYAWEQLSGSPTVTLNGTGSNRTFVAPGTVSGTVLTFQLTVTGSGGVTAVDTVQVTILNHNRFMIAANGTTRVPVKHGRVN